MANKTTPAFIKPIARIRIAAPPHGLRIAYLPDCQVHEGVPTKHLEWCGQYLVLKRPDVIIQGGDFAHIPSLNFHDAVGSMARENARYRKDIDSCKRAMDLLMNPIAKVSGWNPHKYMTLGNHEDLITRTLEANPKLEGTISLDDLCYQEYGWKVYPFLQPIVIGGVAFCHYFPSGVMGRPITSARAMLSKLHMSAVAGHQQGRDIAFGKRADGVDMTAIISGCLTPDHKVLTSDLRYIELGNLRVGDKVVSIDENAPSRKRRFSEGTVLALATDIDDVYAVTLQSGKIFKVTKDHQWFVKTGSKYYWKTTDTLRRGTRLPRLLKEWEPETSFNAGWLSGMYDGEGSLYARSTTGGVITQLAISQKKGPTQRRIEVMIKEILGYDMLMSMTSDDVGQLRIKGGAGEVARVLGVLRPQRLLAKFSPEMIGAVYTNDEDLDTVMSVSYIGRKEIVRSKIDTGTYIVEGFAHHNSFYQHAESYLSPYTNNHWRGFVMMHEVKDGSFNEMMVSIDYLHRRFGRGQK